MSLSAATIAANRFGLGARPGGELTKIAKDPRGWLLAQLDAAPPPVPPPLRELPAAGEDLLFYPLSRLERGAYARLAREAAQGEAPASAQVDGKAKRKAQRREQDQRALAAAQARLAVAVTTQLPFRERLVHFWSDHFTVSGLNPTHRLLPPSFEREVVRPRVAGAFADLLSAATRHPAMLQYLDNVRSVGPHSWYAQHPGEYPGVSPGPRAKTLGLNENLAREILELHTVGVDGPYSQRDVEQFARALTGWAVAPLLSSRREQRKLLRQVEQASDPVAKLGEILGELRTSYAGVDGRSLFRFDARAHEPGPVTIMGSRYAQAGVDQAQAVLDRLARHPSTAQYLAGKLCQHFIADVPAPSAVARVAQAMRDSEGDLAHVATALVACPQAWESEQRKFKRPEEYVVSTLRALEVTPAKLRPYVRLLGEMGQMPYRAPGPDGWPDEQAHWASPDTVWKRVEWVAHLAQRSASAQREVAELGAQVLGSTYSKPLATAVSRASSPAQAMALLLLSPEFMRR